MKINNYSIYKITLTLSLTLIIMGLMIIPMIRRQSAEFVITTLSISVNLLVCMFIAIKLYVMRKKIRN